MTIIAQVTVFLYFQYACLSYNLSNDTSASSLHLYACNTDSFVKYKKIKFEKTFLNYLFKNER